MPISVTALTWDKGLVKNFVIGVPSKAAAIKPWLHENRAQNWL